MIKNIKLRIVLFTILIFSLTLAIVAINGKTYDYIVKINPDNINNIVVKLDQDKENIIIKDQTVKDGYLHILLESVSKGRSHIEVYDGDETSVEIFYVHNLGIITKNTFLGRISNDIIIPISIAIYIGFILYYWFLSFCFVLVPQNKTKSTIFYPKWPSRRNAASSPAP